MHKPISWRVGTAAVLAMSCSVAPMVAAWAAKGSAEYSMRWDPAQGGPRSAEDTLLKLGLHASKRSMFEVQYFDIVTPADAPPGFDAIMRKRSNGQVAQLTFKLRGASAWPQDLPSKPWNCPLPRPHERKEEADIAFLAADQVSRAHSRSCTHTSTRLDVQVPAVLQPRPSGCKSRMTRLEAGKLKVERWRMADGSTLLEVSRIGADDAQASADFRDQVVKPLLALQALPVQRSKSAIGSDCTK
jgi:hypothetical protein